MDEQKRLQELHTRLTSDNAQTREEAHRELQKINQELLAKRFTWLKEHVGLGHPLYTLFREHEQILAVLNRLEALTAEITALVDYHSAKAPIAQLVPVAEDLLAAETHHAREEDALFPYLEKFGISGPPEMMRQEHGELRANKHKLAELVKHADNMPFDQLKSELAELSKFIVTNLRDHIFKEDHILYPAALQNIGSDSDWNSIKEKCDQIGYCRFTPIGAVAKRLIVNVARHALFPINKNMFRWYIYILWMNSAILGMPKQGTAFPPSR